MYNYCIQIEKTLIELLYIELVLFMSSLCVCEMFGPCSLVDTGFWISCVSTENSEKTKCWECLLGSRCGRHLFIDLSKHMSESFLTLAYVLICLTYGFDGCCCIIWNIVSWMVSNVAERKCHLITSNPLRYSKSWTLNTSLLSAWSVS